MKSKYRDITVPYRIFDNKENFTYYIYNDKVLINIPIYRFLY